MVLRSCGESSRDCEGVCQLRTQDDLVLAPTRRDLCPWSGWFSASLMLSQVLQDWIGIDVVFCSPVILRFRRKSSRGLWRCPPTPHPRWPDVGADQKGCVYFLRVLICSWNLTWRQSKGTFLEIWFWRTLISMEITAYLHLYFVHYVHKKTVIACNDEPHG